MAQREKPNVILSQQYACTITLNPKCFKHEIIQQRNLLQQVFNELIGNDKLDASIIVELTETGNVHGHGFVKVPLSGQKNPIFLIQNVFRQYKDRIGFICIKPITTYHDWLHYCLKDYAPTKIELDGENPIVLDNMGDFSINDVDVLRVMSGTCECGWKRPPKHYK